MQKFLDDLFKAILSIREDKPPLAVKYFFDFLEEQAEKRGISDPDTHLGFSLSVLKHLTAW